MSTRLASPMPVALSERGNAVLQPLGVLFLLAYLTFLQSRVLDFTVPQLHLPMMLLIGITGIALISGTLFAGLRTSMGRLLVLFVFLLGVSTLFSINRYESASIVMGATRNLIMAFAITALLVTVRDIRRSLQAVAWGTLMAGILGFIFQVTVEGERLGLAVGRFGDPNDYAMVLIMGLPLWLTVGSGVFRVILGLPAAAIIFVSFARTGSRGGLLAFAVLSTVYFFTTSLIGKVRIVVLMVILAVGAVVMVPEGIQRRYFTIFSAADEDSINSADESQRTQGYINSSNSRKALLLASLAATVSHPIFGVGPGNFPQYYWTQGFIEEKRNRQGMHTHNTYTQISSEAGIPAVLCLLSILFLCFRATWRAGQDKRLPPDHPIRLCGRALWLSMLSWAAAAMFLSTAWTESIFVYVAVVASLMLVHRNTIAALQSQVAVKEQPPVRGPLPRNAAVPAFPRKVRPLLRPIS